MENLFNFTLKELEINLVENGFKTFNARQVYEWLYKKKVYDFKEYSNISKAMREYLSSHFVLNSLDVSSHQISSDGTEKFLFELEEGNVLETVLLRYN